MKKFFEQPALEVVRMKNNDIVTTSPQTINVSNTLYEGSTILAPGQRGIDSWYEGY